MSSNDLEQISQDLDRIALLPLAEQITEFSQIRDKLEAELSGKPDALANENSAQVR